MARHDSVTSEKQEVSDLIQMYRILHNQESFRVKLAAAGPIINLFNRLLFKFDYLPEHSVEAMLRKHSL
jgi:hypothetical protein